MKRLQKPVLAALVITCVLTTTASVSANASSIFINNEPVITSVEPYIKNGYTLAPIRVISENLGCKVSYDNSSQKVTITKSNTTTELWIGKHQAKVNGSTQILDTAPEIKDGSTMVPLRFIAEAFGCTIDYNPDTKDIKITSSGIGDTTPTNPTTPSEPQVATDTWGNKLRTTNLPSNASMYPYIREEIPNWVYDQAALAWNDNYWGPGNNPDRPITQRKLLDSPSEWWNSADGGLKYWDGEYMKDNNKQLVSNKLMVEEMIRESTNINYRNITIDADNKISHTLVDYAKEFMSPYTIVGETKKDLGVAAASYLAYAKHNEVVMSSEFKVLYEGAWREYNGGDFIMEIPVYVKINFENIKEGDKYFDFLGGTLTNGARFPGIKNSEIGDVWEAVVTYTLVMNPKTKQYQFNFSHFNIWNQISPTVNLLGGVSPANHTDAFVPDWTYSWMEKGNYITRYTSDYDKSILRKNK